MSPRAPHSPALRRVFLARPPVDGVAELHPGDVDHALRVLRLVAGDLVLAIDGRGRAWRCAVGGEAPGGSRSAGHGRRARGVVLERTELVQEEPAPGEGGAEGAGGLAACVYVALPKPGPAEEMLDRLTQLGAARIVPLATEHAGPHARELAPARRERFERIAREALKQSGRLWMPEIAAPIELEELLRAGFDAPCALLAPGGATRFVDWALERRAKGERRVAVVVGPEGGLTEAEEEALVARGAVPCALARHVLRIETAAEAAMAVLAASEA